MTKELCKYLNKLSIIGLNDSFVNDKFLLKLLLIFDLFRVIKFNIIKSYILNLIYNLF